MGDEQAAHHLLNVLEERGLNVDLDKVLLGFEDEKIKSATAAWVNEYLHENTLLTKEELELYQTLRRKGLLRQYENDREQIRPLHDHEIAQAIESLQSSAAAIDAQSKILEAQKEALMRLKALDKPNLDVERTRNERRRKEGQERARLDLAIDDMCLVLNERFADIQKEIHMDKSSLRDYLAGRLDSDDQILSRLPGIASKIVNESQASQEENSIEQWCIAIKSFRAAEIKARVDTVYLNSLGEYTTNDVEEEPESRLKERKAALQGEMEELHSEIASITEMIVEHEIRKPIDEAKERASRDTARARKSWLDYVLSTLDYMGQRLDTVAASARQSHELQQVLSHIEKVASKCMPDTQTAAPTPTRRRTMSATAFTPLVKLKPATSLRLPAPLQDALRFAGLSTHYDNIEALQEALTQTHLERAKKLRDHYDSSQALTHDKVAERTSKADVGAGVITNVLYRHTPFHQVHLVNPELEQRMKDMERNLEEKDRELVDAENSELRLGSPKVQAFISKYGKR